MSRDRQHELLEEILRHCREIARLEQEFERLEGRAPKEGRAESQGLESTAGALRRVLEEKRRAAWEASREASAPDQQGPSRPAEKPAAGKDELPAEERPLGPPPPPSPPRAPSRPVTAAEDKRPKPSAEPVYTAKATEEKTSGPFMTEEEYAEGRGALGPLPEYAPRKASPDSEKAPARKQESGESLEQWLGTTWLLRIGGLLLLIGVAYGAMKLHTQLTPLIRISLGYLLGAVLLGVGFLASRRHLLVGRTTVAIGLSTGYFISFAAHYLDAMRVFTSMLPSVGLMIGFALAIVLLAERWRSEVVAGFGFGLGALAALVSAPSSVHFSLVALGVLALGAGILLLRNEWTRLTALALVGAYLATAILWVVLGVDEIRGVIVSHLGALFLYHLIFAAAFWRWSRPWLAREAAAERAAEQEAIPEMKVGLLPYSRAFAILNSLGLISLSVLLLWVTRVYWGEVEWLLFALAGLEAGRLAIPASRRGSLAPFHIVTALALLTGGLIAALGGLVESAVMALQALVLVVAGSRAPQLRWLRPLAVIPSMLAMISFDVSGLATIGDFLGVLTPPVLILASALPWNRILVFTKAEFSRRPADWIERISAAVRSLEASMLILVSCAAYFGAPWEITFVAASIAALVLLAGVVILSARAWMIGAATVLLITALGAGLHDFNNPGAWAALLGIWLGCLYFWEEATKQNTDMPHRVFQWIAAPALSLGLAWSFLQMADSRPLATWWIAALVGGASYGIYRGVTTLGRFPSVVPPAIAPANASAAYRNLARYNRPSLLFAILAGGLSIWATLRFNAPVSPVPALLLAAAFLALWIVNRRSIDNPSSIARDVAFSAILLVLFTLVWPIFADQALASFLPGMAGALALLAAAFWRRHPGSMLVGLWAASLIGVYTIGLSAYPEMVTSTRGALAGLALAGLLIGGTRLAAHARRELVPTLIPGQLALNLRGAESAWTVFGAMLTLELLSKGILLSGTFITVAWGVLGIGLLIGGFVFLDRTMRYTSFVIFALSLGRIVLIDLADSNDLTRVVAFIGLGLLLIGAGVVYGLLSRHLLSREKARDGREDTGGV